MLLTKKKLQDIMKHYLERNEVTQEGFLELYKHIGFLEAMLDETDENDFFGTEGWRHTAGLED
jgi:hypothetical protein